MNLAEFSVKAPVKITMIFLLIVLLGLVSCDRLPINLFPDIQAPRITTEVRTGGLSPQEIERRIAQPFERALYTVRGVVDVKSISRADTAILITEFTWDSPMDYAFLDVKKAVAEVQRNLSDDIQSVSVLRYDPNARPIITLSLVGDKDTDQEELLQLAKKVLEPQFERIEGVASVVITGGEERELLIALNETKMLADSLDVKQVIAAIQNANINASGGWIDEGARRYLLKAVGELNSIDEIADITVGRRGSVPIQLGEIAVIQYVPKEKKNIVRFDGKPAVGMAFYKESLGNTVGVAAKVVEEIKRLEKMLPKGLKLIVAQDQSTFIKSSISEVTSNAIAGGVLAIVVLFFFLRDLRSTSIIALAIPISIVATFNLMYFLDLSLNLMTLGGLALGVGMLVDNAIVALENIHRLHTQGLDARAASIQGSREVAGALIASTLTTVVVFLPIVYVHGVAGLLFKEQALTVSFSLIASLVVAILLIPLMAYWLYHASETLRPKTPESSSLAESPVIPVSQATSASESPAAASPVPTSRGHNDEPLARDFLARVYAGTLRWSLSHRFLVFAMGGASLAVAAVIGRGIPQEFFPKTPQKEIRLRLVLPPSATIESTDDTAKVVEANLKSLEPVIDHVYVRLGETEEQSSSNLEDPDGPNTAEVIIRMKDTDKPTTVALAAGLEGFTSLDLIDRMEAPLERLPDVRSQFEAEQGGIMDLIGGAGAPLLIEIRGPESDMLTSLADQLWRKIKDLPGLANARTNITQGAPEALLHLDNTAMAAYGFDTRSLASAVSDRLQGSVASTMKNESGDTDIRVRITKEQETVSALKEMVFQSPTGARVPLGALAEIAVHRGPREIVRRRQERVAYVMADLDRIRLSEAIERVQTVVTADMLPRGYTLAFTGEQQQKREAFGRLGFALVLSVVLVYMVMASIFESFLQPFLILVTIPLSGIGVVIGLAMAGQSLNVMAMIGIILLGGIVVNNAIVLLDRVNQLRARGFDRIESLVIGSTQRLRPVLMTSATTILGLIPLALGIGEGAELRQAMAISVIGGMTSSTILTLIVIPCGQSLLDGFLRFAGKLLTPLVDRFRGHSPAAAKRTS